METFGARVRLARDVKGWTQEQLARATGERAPGKPYVYSGVVVSRWEKDHGAPHDPDVIVRLCDALGVSADWLLRGLGDPPTHTEPAASSKPTLRDGIEALVAAADAAAEKGHAA